MTITDYLTTFKLTNEREKRVLINLLEGNDRIINNITDKVSNLYESTKQVYNRIPAIVRAGAFVGLGVLGTLGYQKINASTSDHPKTDQKIWVSYHENNSGDAKDVPFDWAGFVTLEQYENLRSTRYIDIKDVEFRR
ncbi:MAG: hypothetical protein Q7K45_00390 [Nanoarchaeota archaeon]|nr:hypothetical protein [Nanoarchaeota archaeon]